MTRTKKITACAIGMITLATVVSNRSAVALEQVVLGQDYNFHTRATGACPAANWELYVDGDRAIMGSIAWDRMNHVATIYGKLNPDDTFSLEAREPGAKSGTMVNGKVTESYVKMSLAGMPTGCDMTNLVVPRTANIQAGGGAG
jgi:hypothetical protein